MTIAALFITFFILVIIGAPIAVALGGSVVVATTLFSPIPLAVFGQKIYGNLDHFTLMAVPFFFLAAAYMERGGIVRHLVNLANHLVGHLRGGLGMTTVLSCMFFASISGSSAATVAAVGGIMVPALVKRGYPREYAVGAVATGGGIGILIPPSIPLILYGFVTETSIPKLFIGGILPGLLYGGLLMLVARFLAYWHGVETAARVDWRERAGSLWTALPALSLPVFLIVGIYGFPPFSIGDVHFRGGAIFTPTEAAVMLAFAALLIGRYVYRQASWWDTLATTIAVAPRIGMIFWIVTNAILFSFLLAQEGVPTRFAEWLVSIDMPAWIFLLLVNLALIIAGLFMDGVPMILLFAPVLFPAAVALGIDPIHLGIIMVVNIELGLLTPPVGLNLYVASTITGMPLTQVMRAVLPWMAATVLMLIVVTYVPIISTFLPSMMVE